jgi:acid phosphatase (class A)
MKRLSIPALALGLIAAAPAHHAKSEGYLTPAQDAEIAGRLPPPPETGSARDLADKAAARAAYSPLGSPRALVAEADAETDPDVAMARFDCVIGARLQAAKAPALRRLFARTLEDGEAAWTPLKSHWMRARPNLALGLEPCVAQALRQPPSSSFPAGHAVLAELWGRTLAALAPDRAEAIATRARQIGDSRVVCALHYPSDVEAGAKLGAALYTAISATPAYRADLEAARVEVAAARGKGLENPGCTAERAALGAGN